MPRSRVRPPRGRLNARSARARLGPLLIVAALTLSACAGPVVPDLVITNARVFTNDTARPWAEAVAIKGQSVVAVGDTASVLAKKGTSTRVIDAGGRVLVPGLNDARVDLPLEPPTPASLSALDRAALSHGVTSLQVVAGGPMRALVDAARQAQRQARWRVIRSPMDGERPQDEEPFLPPDPGVRLVAKGVSWLTGGLPARAVAAPSRLPTVVGWAYGAEDPLIIGGDGRAWLEALAAKGIADVWQRKRPRLDLVTAFDADVAELRRLGVVVTWLPETTVPDTAWIKKLGRPPVSAGVLVDGGVVLAMGSGAGAGGPLAALAASVTAGGYAPGRPLTREEAVRAVTWGSAFAEKTEREKGWLGPGALADIAVLSDDIFTVPADRLPAITSVLTLVGGTIVYDAGVLPH